jgi:hypothetical protein
VRDLDLDGLTLVAGKIRTTSVLPYGRLRRRSAESKDPRTAVPALIFSMLEAGEPGVLGPRRIDNLPTDTDALQRALEGELARANSDYPDLDTGFRPGSGVPREEQLLTLIGQTLAHPLASPELRGALYDVASRLNRVKVTEGVKDPAGRPATSITLKRSAIHYAVVFDPATSGLLATGRVAHEPGLRYSDYTLYLERATVNSIRERP